MPARFVQLLVASLVILPGTAAHSTLPPLPADLRPAPALAPAPADDGPALGQPETAPAPASAAREGEPSARSVESDGFVPCPVPGKRQNLQGKIDSAVIRAASEQLDVPMGRGRQLSIKGRTYLFCGEAHYREPGSGPGPQGWHKGVTVYEEP